MDDNRIVIVSNMFVGSALTNKLKQYNSDINIINNMNPCFHSSQDNIICWWNLYKDKSKLYTRFLIGELSKEKYIDEYTYEFINYISNLNLKCDNTIVLSQDMFFSDEYLLMKDIISSCNIITEVNDHIKKNIPNNVILIDINKIIARVGIRNVYDLKNGFRWDKYYTDFFYDELFCSIENVYKATHYKSKKCIILDCDNVLWGGILSECGISGILLGGYGTGLAYQIFQKLILNLYYFGIVICICSKNDSEDVYEVFEKHTGMILKKENIAYFSLSWTRKSDCIKKMSNEINISTSDMLFVDDSEYEVNEVKKAIPDIETLHFDLNNFQKIMNYFNFYKKPDILTSMQRQNTYKSLELIRNNKNECENFNIDLNISINKAEESEAIRISELSMRCNKCTNGKRYNYNQIINLINLPEYDLYSVYATDIYMEYGLIATVGVNKNYIDLFAVSCRVLGRGIEDIIIEKIICKNKIHKILFEETQKNSWLKLSFSKRNISIESKNYISL